MADKRFDLEERTLSFAKDVRTFLRKIPVTSFDTDDKKQLTRSSGSIGANYIEANEAIGKGDFVMRLRICLKEAKESSYWLRVIEIPSGTLLSKELLRLRQEALELLRIFVTIVQKVRPKRTL